MLKTALFALGLTFVSSEPRVVANIDTRSWEWRKVQVISICDYGNLIYVARTSGGDSPSTSLQVIPGGCEIKPKPQVQCKNKVGVTIPCPEAQ